MSEARTVVVTGAFGALGSAVARMFLAQGAQVALIGHGGVPDWARAAFLPPHELLGGIDLTDAAQAQAAMGRSAGSAELIDVLVNVAGGFRFQQLADGDPAVWDLMYGENLKTAVVAAHAALPYLRVRGGCIVNIGAAAAARAHAGMGAYAASKAGVERLTESLAEELRADNITVNAILPGTLDTPANRAAMPQADTAGWVKPEDLAQVVSFLASDGARAVNGAAIRVTGHG